MKLFRKIASLILALTMLISMVYIAPVATQAESVPTTVYAANLSVKTTKITNLRTAASTDATAKYTLPVGTMLTVQSLQANSSGYWYKVLYYDTTLYVDATATTMVSHLTGDVTATDLMTPAALGIKNGFPLKGTIKSTLNKLGTVTASVHYSSNISAEPAIVSTDTINGYSYTIDDSKLDNNLIFSDLAAGSYTFMLTVEAISYYVDDSGTLATSIQTVVLDNKPCIVTNASSPNPVVAKGIDVSFYQGNINWATVSKQVDFAILRLGYYTTMDSKFTTYAAACNTYDVPFGVYLYSYAENTDEALQEANFVISALKNYDVSLPVFYDFEDACQASLSASAKHAIVKTFCDTVKAAGYDVGLYTFLSWFNASFTDSYYSSMPKWVAQVDVSKCSYTKGLTCWQYSWKGSFSGISGDVDCDYWYGEFPGKNTDTSYLASCTYYPSHLKVTTTGAVNMRQYPSTGYSNLETIGTGEELEVTGVYKNASGEYWYQVNRNGTTGYIHASYAVVQEYLYDDISVVDPTMAGNLPLNKGYNLQGTVNALYNNLQTVYGKVYKGEDTQVAPVLSSSDRANAKKYKLIRSTVCDNLIFSDLDTGYYTYEISADVANYYVDNGVLTSKSKNVVVWTAPFTVGDAKIESDATVCTHVVVTDAAVTATCTSPGLTEGSHCSVCGLVFAHQTQIPALGHDYHSSIIPATCQDYEKIRYTCGNCGDSYSSYTHELDDQWSETKPEGVDESELESKQQYRYSDYETITSYDSVLAGYTLLSKQWEKTESGTVNYVTGWPSGFDTGNRLYTVYNNTKKTASETATTKTELGSDTLIGYIYWHWCRGTYTAGPINRTTSTTQDSTHTSFHAFFDTTDPATLDAAPDVSYTLPNDECCTDTYWYYALPVYAQTYTTYNAQFVYGRWTEYSEWSDTAVTATDTRKVQTRTVYRYIDAPLGDHTYVAGVCTLCGFAEKNKEYFLFGRINGADYGCEGDADNIGIYRFEDGKLKVKFTQASYVAVKTGDNAKRYMTSGWQGEVTSATLYNADIIGSSADMLYVPGGVEITFTLTENANGSLTLSYVTEQKVIPSIVLQYPSLSFEDQIQYNVYFTATNTQDVVAMGLVIFDSKLTDGTIADAVDVVGGYVSSGNNYMVHTRGIPAKNLGDAVYFKVCAKLTDGSYVYSDVAGYNAVAYAKTVLSSSTSTMKAKALMVAMLNYGAAAQEFFGYKTDSLMNAFLSDAGKALAAPYDESMVDPVVQADSTRGGHFVMNKTAFTNIYPTVSFEGAFTINYYVVNGLTPDSGITFCYWDAATYESADKLTTANATGILKMTQDGDRWYASVDGIAAKDMDKTIYVAAIYKSGGTAYTTSVIAYSLGKYCETIAARGDAFGAATAVYGYYAKAYFA